MNFNKIMLYALSLSMLAVSNSCNKEKESPESSSMSKPETTSIISSDTSIISNTVNNITKTIIESTPITSEDNHKLVINNDNTITVDTETFYLDKSAPLNEIVVDNHNDTNESSTNSYNIVNVIDELLDMLSNSSYSIISNITEVSMGSMTSYPAIDIVDLKNNKSYHLSNLFGVRINTLIANNEAYVYDNVFESYVLKSIYDVDVNSITSNIDFYYDILNAPIIDTNNVVIDNDNYVRVSVDAQYLNISNISKAYIYFKDECLKTIVLIGDTLSALVNFDTITTDVVESYLIINDTTNEEQSINDTTNEEQSTNSTTNEEQSADDTINEEQTTNNN